MKILVTGAAGFVGGYLIRELNDHGHTAVGTDIQNADYITDLLDKSSVAEVLKNTMPDAVIHLAGQSSVAFSWKVPQTTVNINVCGTLNLLDEIREYNKNTRVLIIGSSDQYGKVKEQDCPIKETQPLVPVNPYAVSKCTQEDMGKLYAKAYGMDIVFTRSFNHSGPGQKQGFVIPDFCSKIAYMQKSGENILKVGNLTARRDFSDVRDIVRAYRLITEKGVSGEVYNVGCGKAYYISDILEIAKKISGVDIKTQQDPEKMRPIDLPLIQSCIEKLHKDTGFVPVIPLERTIEDTYLYWMEKYSKQDIKK